MSNPTSFAFLGLGAMGQRMAARLLSADRPLSVWNRTPGRADTLVERGARRAESPGEAASAADVIILMLADPAAVEQVLLGHHGVLAGARRGALVIDCSTIGPEDSRAMFASCEPSGVAYVDAPVLGSVKQAEAGELVALIGGPDDLVTRAKPVLASFAKRVVHAGNTGQGSALKLVMNLLVGGFTELLAEAITLAQRSGLSSEALRDVLMSSVLASPFVGYKAPQLLERNFAPLFSTQLLLKDLDLIVHQAHDVGAPLPATSVIRELYARSAAAGRGDLDFSAVIDQLAGEPIPPAA